MRFSRALLCGIPIALERIEAMNRKFAWLVTLPLLACVHLADAQQPKKIPRIGVLSTGTGAFLQGFRQGLRDLGYVLRVF